MRLPCDTHLCEHGDATYDPDNDGSTYDGSECRCQRCPNFSVCETWSPQGTCQGCRALFGTRVLVPAGTAECPVCLATTECVRHPAGCRHSLCGGCLVALSLIEPEQPQPSDFGFVRTCPCEDEGAPWGTHECDECAEALEAWEATEDGQAWVDACIDAGDDDGGLRRCPVCRASA